MFCVESIKFQRHRTKIHYREYGRFVCVCVRSAASVRCQLVQPIDNCVQVFQQDGSQSHPSRITQDHLEKCTPIFIKKCEWPPESLDCNPTDYTIGTFSMKTSTETGQKSSLSRNWNMLLYTEVGANDPITDPLLPLFREETPKACVSGSWGPYRTFTLTTCSYCQLFHDMQFFDMSSSSG